MRVLAVLCLILGAVTPALAHPHVFVSVKSVLVLDSNARITAIKHLWTFDEAFSAYASLGLDADKDGVLSEAELAPLAQVNVETLHESAFFTFLRKGKNDLPFDAPKDYKLTHDGKQLTLHFTLPLQGEAVPVRETKLEVYDPAYFVAFDFAADAPVQVEGAACSASIKRPKARTIQSLSQMSESFFESLTGKGGASDWATIVSFSCK
jgi:ABC-type uncharacterized transport system substrate-binding protein